MNHLNVLVRNASIVCALLAAAMPPTFAVSNQIAQSSPGEPTQKIVQTGTGDMTDGEVRKVDAEQGKVTLRHAEIKDLDMPAMTMVFVLKDKGLLAKIKPGDKVKFRAVNDGGKFTVTEIQTVP